MAAESGSNSSSKRKRERSEDSDESGPAKKVRSILPSSTSPVSPRRPSTAHDETKSKPRAVPKGKAAARKPRGKPDPRPKVSMLSLPSRKRSRSAPPTTSTLTSEGSNQPVGPSRWNFDDDAVLARFQESGSRYQAWIDDPAQEECPVNPATLTFQEMFNPPAVPDPLVTGQQKIGKWEGIGFSYREPMDSVKEDVKTVGLPAGEAWSQVILRQPGWSGVPETFKWSEYIHRVTEGAIIAAAITRHHGPHWSEVALAHYTQVSRDINTLKYVYFTDVVNIQTEPYINKLYVDNQISVTGGAGACYWKYDTIEYQTLLGTAIGKGVACLVLGAWPRGTRRITQIKTFYYDGEAQLRFDIGPIGSDLQAEDE